MSRNRNPLRLVLSSAIGTALFATAAFAGSTAYSTASNYNTPYGMTAGEENAAINPSMRDSDGNLVVVNGQVTTANFGLNSSGVQSMSTIGSSSLFSSSSSSSSYSSTSSTTSSGVGTSTATAIGNSLNVVTVGNNNTVIVTASQTNNGDQTATVTTN